MDGSDPDVENAIVHNNKVYYLAYDGVGATTKLFSNDATTIERVSGTSTFTIFSMYGIYQNELYFWGWDQTGTIGPALYKTDMNIDNEVLVLDLDPTSTSNYLSTSISIVFNNILYFIGPTEVEGYEIWRTDGTAAGTYILKDIEPGTGSSMVFTTSKNYFGVLNNQLYFGAGNSTNGAELWTTDGTEAGTQMVRDIETDNSFGSPQYGSNPSEFIFYNNKLYFSAYTIAQGRELWTTDGTEAGTVLVKDMAPGSSSPISFTVYNNKIYFHAYRDGQGYSLYASDGTNAGTQVVKEISAGGPNYPENFAVYDNKLFFKAENTTVFAELWSTDGTAAGTAVAANYFGTDQSSPQGLLPTTNYLYLQAMNPSGEYKIFRGSSPMSSATMISTDASIYAEEPEMFLINNCLLFVGNDGNTGKEFYKICNQNTSMIGIDENDLKSNCFIYPNPASDFLYIYPNNNYNNNIVAKLYSMDGKCIQTVNIGILNTNNATQLTLPANITTGMYTIILEENNEPIFYSRVSVIK